MQFEWDEEKAKTNLEKHGISFETAANVFYDENRVELYDEEDCPEITPEMLKRAYRPGRKRSGDTVTLRIQVLPSTLDKAKKFGENYMSVLGELLDKAVNDYADRKKGAIG